VKKRETVLVWLHPATRSVMVQAGTDADWLALKIAAEGIDTERLAEKEGVPLAVIEKRSPGRGKGAGPRAPLRIRRIPKGPSGVRWTRNFSNPPSSPSSAHTRLRSPLQALLRPQPRSSLGLERHACWTSSGILQDRHVRARFPFRGNPSSPGSSICTGRRTNGVRHRVWETPRRWRPGAMHRIRNRLLPGQPRGLREHNVRSGGKAASTGSSGSAPPQDAGSRPGDAHPDRGTTWTRSSRWENASKGLTDGSPSTASTGGGGANSASPPGTGISRFLASYLKASERNPVLTQKTSLQILLRRGGEKALRGLRGFGAAPASIPRRPSGRGGPSLRKFPPSSDIPKRRAGHLCSETP
jgi:hypothetical protein